MVMRGRVFDQLKTIYPAVSELDRRPGLNIAERSKLNANAGDWEKEIATKVLSFRESGPEDERAVNLDIYWRNLVGNQTTYSECDSELACETSYAIQNFHVRVSMMGERLEELEEK